MSGIFNEDNMRRILDGYIPAGETLIAGIHAISKESRITGVYGKCRLTEDRLVPDENGGPVALEKEKYATYDIYIGITQSYLIIADCENNNSYYCGSVDVSESKDVQEVTSDIFLDDIGNCFLLTDIESCEIGKGWMGSVKCLIKMKNGSYFKLLFPKLGGLGGGMPHHAEYRDAIIERLAKTGE